MTSIDHDAWIPRDDMAVLGRCSPDTITRDHKKHELQTRTDAAGRVLVNVGDYLRIGRIRPEDLTAGATPAESAEIGRARDVVTDLKTQLAELTGRLGLADLTAETRVLDYPSLAHEGSSRSSESSANTIASMISRPS